MKRCYSLSRSLEELERRDPKVKAAREKLDKVADDILQKARSERMTKKESGENYALLMKLVEKTLLIRALKARHAAVFSELAALEKEAGGIEEAFKAGVREKSVPGETIVVYDDEAAKVTVSGPIAAPSYDASIARKSWPSIVLDAVTVLDDKKCRALIEGGVLPAALAEEAELPERLLTPAVKIEIRGGAAAKAGVATVEKAAKKMRGGGK